MSKYEWHMEQSYGARMQQRAIARDELCKKIVDMAIAYHDAPANSKIFALNDLENSVAALKAHDVETKNIKAP
jgi:hypothetical protein